MRDLLENLCAYLIVGSFTLLIGAIILAWPIYKYKDCKKVGHSTFYCILDFGK